MLFSREWLFFCCWLVSFVCWLVGFFYCASAPYSLQAGSGSPVFLPFITRELLIFLGRAI